MDYKILVDSRDVNDATSFYIDIIRQAAIKAGHKASIIYSIADLRSNDVAVVVKVTTAYRVLRQNKRQKMIIWLQGIQPEEMLMSDTPLYKKIYYYLALRYLEWKSFKNIPFMIYVSEEMKRHYEKKFGPGNRCSFIMPCFNLGLDEKSFFAKERYNNPSFVYAGSLDAWQCFEKTLDIFYKVKSHMKNASLTILTKDTDKAQLMAKMHNLDDVEIKYVPKEMVQAELKKFKYGFIIREDVKVNRVATPTKLNSYMASGVIPIVSDSLIDFVDNTKECKYICRIGNDLIPNTVAEKIIKFETYNVDVADICNEYSKVFANYYNAKKYIDSLSKQITTFNENITFDRQH